MQDESELFLANGCSHDCEFCGFLTTYGTIVNNPFRRGACCFPRVFR